MKIPESSPLQPLKLNENDDSKIDYPEFKEFFGDAHASENDVKTFFERCDTDKSKNIDHAELITFFSTGNVGKTYTPIFATLERMHAELNAALIASHAANSANKDPTELFKERFFLREIANQLETLQGTAEIGLRGVSSLTPIAADAAQRERFEIPMPAVDAAASNADFVAPLHKQVDRLQKLISRLEKGHVRFNVPEEEIGVSTDSDALFIVARHFTGGAVAEVATAARTYVAAVCQHDGCRHVAVRVVRGDTPEANELFIHEIWEEGEDFDEFEASAEGKALQAALSAKAKNTKVDKLHLPASWFIYA